MTAVREEKKVEKHWPNASRYDQMCSHIFIANVP